MTRGGYDDDATTLAAQPRDHPPPPLQVSCGSDIDGVGEAMTHTRSWLDASTWATVWPS